MSSKCKCNPTWSSRRVCLPKPIEKNQDNEIRRRITARWQAFEKCSTIMKSTLPTCLKRKVFNQCILPVMTYGAETWTLTTKIEKKLSAAQHNMERSMLNITYKDWTTEMNYNSTGAMWTGTWEQETKTFRGNIAKLFVLQWTDHRWRWSLLEVGVLALPVDPPLWGDSPVGFTEIIVCDGQSVFTVR